MFKVNYPHLDVKREYIIDEITNEEKKFLSTIKNGLKELIKLSDSFENINAQNIFNLYSTYGFPVEMSIEEINDMAKQKGVLFDSHKFLNETKQLISHHQEISRAGADKKFKGGLADTQVETTRLHTAAHLFLESARRVLGSQVHQKGSNITSERMRFDISYHQKLSDEQILQIENLVNMAIAHEYDRVIIDLSTKEAFILGAEGEFEDRYGERVNIYKFYKNTPNSQEFSVGINEAIEKNPSILNDFKDQEVFSFEICGGPHVANTRELAQSGNFKIIKEESVSAGVRRIKAILQK